MNFYLKGVFGAAVLAATVGASAQLYSQGDPGDNGFFADGVDGQFYDQRIAESFVLAGNASVDTIGWSGGSEFFTNADLTNFSSFWLRIYSDVAGLPGAEIWSANYATAATNPVANGSFGFGSIRYDHSVSTGGVNLAGGTYWLSVGGVAIDPFDDAYVWAFSTNTYDDIIAAEVPFGSGYAAYSGFGEVAFTIDGVPEPGTFVAIGAGLLGLLITRRRR